MAVFTSVSDHDIAAWLADYPLGPSLGLRGIASGIENSNFFLTTANGEYVLTIFEKLRPDELPYYLNLMRHLAGHGISVPDPVQRADGSLFGLLHGKPAAIVTRLPGSAELSPAPAHCAEVGTMLARSHLAGQDFGVQQPNLRSLSWWREVTPLLHPFLTVDQAQLLADEIAHQSAFFASDDYRELPGGPCHCDLFRDNVLFVNDPADATPRLGGFFDFYFAGNDKWLFDLAVTVNDWCVDLDSGELDMPRVTAMLQAYQQVRALTAVERRHWRDMLRAGALRFWTSRLYDFHLPRSAALLQAHDPQRFERTLRARIRAQDATIDGPLS
ncbi:homoserine kinase [Robbsia sp. KACC 23696]|uniref:homoserine kinase n=1 Tax=Robbsia sp. KACC 23696 TaxID=3149231 RepID=UPI00325A49F4